MKRDMELVRILLRKLEEHEHGRAPRQPSVEGYPDDIVGYHYLIMSEAGLIIAIPYETLGQETPIAFPSRLTWAGHDFLDASRDEGRWKTAKAVFAKLGGVPFDVATKVLSKIATDQAELALKALF